MGLMDDADKITTDLAFSSGDQFLGVETFTYHPRGGSPVTVTGSVFRDPTAFDPARMTNMRRLRVFISKTQIEQVDCPGDEVELAETLGRRAERYAVKEILSQDAGGWELLL